MIRHTPILLATFVAGSVFAAAPNPAPAEAPVEIVNAEFGIFVDGSPNELVFAPTDKVPRKPGQRYGWVIEVRTAKRTLSVREEYLLAEPDDAGKTADPLRESLNIPARRRNQVSQRQLAPVDGRIYGEWSIGPDEPPGHRHLQVVIEEQLAASFKYDVE